MAAASRIAAGCTAVLGVVAALSPAQGAAAYSCGGFAQLGGAQLLCSHVDPEAPAQICTFSWTLSGAGGAPAVVQGSFALQPGQSNVMVYQGSGFAYALGLPVVLCQARKTGL